MLRDRVPSVLFLCSDNAVRSQMAEAFVRVLGNGRVQACSAGLAPAPVHPLTYVVMNEIGIELGMQQAKSAAVYLGRAVFDVAIIVAEAEERDAPRLFPGTLRLLRWPCPHPDVPASDPTALLDSFRRARDRIRDHARAWLATATSPATAPALTT